MAFREGVSASGAYTQASFNSAGGASSDLIQLMNSRASTANGYILSFRIAPETSGIRLHLFLSEFASHNYCYRSEHQCCRIPLQGSAIASDYLSPRHHGQCYSKRRKRNKYISKLCGTTTGELVRLVRVMKSKIFKSHCKRTVHGSATWSTGTVSSISTIKIYSSWSLLSSLPLLGADKYCIVCFGSQEEKNF